MRVSRAVRELGEVVLGDDVDLAGDVVALPLRAELLLVLVVLEGRDVVLVDEDRTAGGVLASVAPIDSRKFIEPWRSSRRMQRLLISPPPGVCALAYEARSEDLFRQQKEHPERACRC
jgi:hypothetical protein